MYIIGLTGGIASGKSTVSAMLAELGACIIDADKIAHDIILPGRKAYQEIVSKLGADILSDGEINRRKLGQMVFSAPTLRSWLENVTHPAIQQEVERQIITARQQEYDVAVLDVPLLFEVGWQTAADEIWVVYVSPEIQLARLMERSLLPQKEALDRINAQKNLDEKAKLAQVVINNNSDIAATSEQVLAAWCSIIKKRVKI